MNLRVKLVICWDYTEKHGQQNINIYIYIPAGPSNMPITAIKQPDIQKGKGRAIPLEAWAGTEGSRRLRLPDFKTTAHEVVRLSALYTGRLQPPGAFLVLNSVRG
jgi:hypothetical protein